MTADFALTGKVAIVTGGNGGIGYGIARGLAQAGADIVVAARQPAKNAQATTNLQVLGVRALSVATDVQDETSVQAMVAASVGTFTVRIPHGRWGEPDELAGAAVFLASRASDYVTGIALPVDGGYTSQ
jgi:NAD(P)-dependent dehydrogenase (short-subunit alcohol dehydrogenase family)